jgi:hypothetical protein
MAYRHFELINVEERFKYSRVEQFFEDKKLINDFSSSYLHSSRNKH